MQFLCSFCAVSVQFRCSFCAVFVQFLSKSSFCAVSVQFWCSFGSVLVNFRKMHHWQRFMGCLHVSRTTAVVPHLSVNMASLTAGLASLPSLDVDEGASPRRRVWGKSPNRDVDEAGGSEPRWDSLPTPCDETAGAICSAKCHPNKITRKLLDIQLTCLPMTRSL